MELEDYEDTLGEEIDEALSVANRARSGEYDPAESVEMELCEDLAERCEKLIGVENLAQRIRDLEDEGYGREEIAVMLADSFVDGEVGDYDTKEEMVDAAIRTAVALLTEGVVAAPIDGIGEVTIDQNDDGTDFIRVPYFGPIRSAGGTGQALSVLVADYIRQKLDIDKFKPREEEVERYAAEMELYDNEVGLQYSPKKKEVKHIIKHAPIMVDGVQTTDGEVEGYRDLERVDGNKGRGGMCLVVGEGIAQKAPKLKKYTDSLDIPGWEWLDELSTVTTTDEEEEDSGEEGESESDGDIPSEPDSLPSPQEVLDKAPEPSKKFMADVIAGRPVFSGPSEQGGFRLRYGRARNLGHAACGYSPATMVIVDDFIATGTQLKTERPGKASGAAPVDSIEGPTVRLSNGELRRIDDVEEARRVQNAVDEIIDVGEILVPYGEFLENNYPLVPASYVHEWWEQEFEDEAGNSAPPEERINPAQAFAFAEKFDIPLHPKWTYLWHDITVDQYEHLSGAVEIAVENNADHISSIHQETLEDLLVPHEVNDKHGRLYIDDEHMTVLERCCSTDATGDEVHDRVMDASGVEVRPKAPVRVGARMGRPEKSNRRVMRPSVHSLFPIGEAGGDQRDIVKAADNNEGADAGFDGEQNDEYRGKGVITTTLANQKCPECNEEMHKTRCSDCDVRTESLAYCPDCGKKGEAGDECKRCNKEYSPASEKELNINEELSSALDNINERRNSFEKLKGVKGLTSSSKIPEPLEKGVLRAKHDVDVFRDGTARFDMVDLPLTHFKPAEIDMSVEEARGLGYDTDTTGETLEDPEQMVELRIQDVILSEGCGEYLVQVANYIDDLLVQYYGMDPYYEVDGMDDLIGELGVGLAPHTSGGVLCRIIGFTEASVGYGHPFFHAAKRRNCFHPETKISYTTHDPTADDAVAVGGTFGTMKTLFNRFYDEVEAETDDFGTEYCEVDGFVRTTSVTPSGKQEQKQITHVSRRPAPEQMVTIETESNRSLTVTPDHDVLVYDEDTEELVEKPAHEVTSGDVFARPQSEASTVGADPSVVPNIEDAIDEELDTVGSRNKAHSEQEEFGESWLDPVESVERHNPDCEYVYNLTVADNHTLSADGLWVKQCDGDEDCVMLLLDGLLNFSKEYLPDARGKRTMDAPLVMTTVIDPYEIDDEAHNVDTVSQYPREFYEATYNVPGPKDVDITIAEDILDDPTGFEYTHDTSNIANGPRNTAYKTLGPMDEKTEAQMTLARKTRAVDESVVADKIVEKHFMPDIIGNLSAFARQEVRCPKCNNKYRRPPLGQECEVCGGDLILTLHEGSVKKYIDIASETAERYGLRNYTHQRIEALEDRINSLFENDQEKQADLSDFF